MVSAADTPIDSRSAERRTAMAPSTLRARNHHATDVTVIDLSTTGIRMRADAALAVGEEISIGLSGVGARRAYVAWARDGEYGCAFLKPLESSEAAQAFASASVVRLGVSEAAAAGPSKAGNDELEALYGRHSLWRLPADALAMTAFYLLILAWGAWTLMAGH